MAKTITLALDGEEYTLEYTREAAKMAEANGLILSEIGDKPNTMIPILIRCAFIAHHRKLKSAAIERITNSVPEKSDLIAALGEMYAETVESLFDTEEEGETVKNATWKKSW